MNARRSILILGWDIDSRFELVREKTNDGFPTALCDFLNALVQRRPELEIRVLSWDYSLILAPDREWAPKVKFDWSTHERMHFELDRHFPAGASHHQKVAVVDDKVAFVGGLDFTRGRWDASDHRADDHRRADTDSNIPQPYHDVQLMVSGKVAADLGDLCRQRWKIATGEELHAPESNNSQQVWPQGLEADLVDTPVGIARTMPAYGQQSEVREVEHLLLDAIARARQWIYIENQYFTAPSISGALASRLDESDGPEVVLVFPFNTVGWLSQNTMDVLRERRINQLKAADRHGRLRVFYPERPGLGKQCINLHSKVMVVDDELVFAGSANLNNRSMGLDTECNLAIEAGADAHRQEGIALLRNRLLAEHLDVAAQDVASELANRQSLIGAISALQHPGRTLGPFPMRVTPELDASVPATDIADPEQPINGEYFKNRLIANEDRAPAWRGLTSLASLLLLTLALAAAWRWTPLSDWVDVSTIFDRMSGIKGAWFAPFIIAAVFIVGGLLMLPVTLMIIATGLAFGAAYGFSYALLGAELSALVTFGIGHYLGHETMKKLPGQLIFRASQALGRQGLLAMITLRIVPVAPFTVVNLVAGASHIRFRDFALGTLLGMIPGTLALAALSDQAMSAIRSPGAGRIAVLAGLALLIVFGSWGIKRWFAKRA
ncbi:MAG: VTT domain-containing protein [Lysobacterales bacterium]